MINYITVVLKIAIIYSFINVLIYKINTFKNISKDEFVSKINNYKISNRIAYYILQLENYFNKKIPFLSPIFFLLMSIVFSIIMFSISYKIFSILSTAIIISVFCLYIPYIVLKEIVNYQKRKILSIFPTYIITLKNYVQMTNDIVLAFRNSIIDGPLNNYIQRFNLSIEKGISVYDSFERLKSDINIKKISEFFTALEYCYINGGDLVKLIERYSDILNKSNLQKEKQRQDSFSAKIVLAILVIINIYMIFAFAYSSYQYKEIITTTFIGQTIININVFSYIFIVFFINLLNKMEE